MPTKDIQILSKLVKRMHSSAKDPLRPLIDTYFMERRRAPERLPAVTLALNERPRPGGRLSPSNLGGCERQAVFQFVGVKGRKYTDPDQENIFEDGIWRHHKWQTIFQDMEKVLGTEVFELIAIEEPVVINELYISGSFDALVRIKGVQYLIDFKGINDAGFTRITMDDAPLHHHVVQLTAYGKARGVRRLIVMYENKNNNQLRNFLLIRTPVEWDEAKEWCMRVVTALRRKRLPNRHVECEAGNFMYERCPFAHLCFGRKDHEEIRELTYEKFPGVKKAWVAGHRIAGTTHLLERTAPHDAE